MPAGELGTAMVVDIENERERSIEAAEFVLGTLDAEDARRIEEALEIDASLRADVAFWRERLMGLDDAMAPVAPSERVWAGIEAALPDAPEGGLAANDNELVALRRSRNAWRFGAMAAALVAVGAGFLASNADLRRQIGLPGDERGTVQLASQEYVAVVNRDGALPALLIKVDGASGRVSVRNLAIERPKDKSLELWWIPEGQKAISVGLVDDDATTIADITPRQGGTFAVTEERPGGSPQGVAEGPVVYSGQLVLQPE